MLLSTGQYLGRIEDYGVYRSDAGQQHLTVFVAFRLLGRYEATSGELGECPPEVRTYTKAITPKTIHWVLADLKAIGFDRDGFRYLDPETPGAVDLFGREIDVYCHHEEYQGTVRERWGIYRERSRAKVGQDELARLDELFGDEVKQVLGDTEPSTPPETPAESAAPTDTDADDIDDDDKEVEDEDFDYDDIDDDDTDIDDDDEQ